jgi:hypothetical protein
LIKNTFQIYTLFDFLQIFESIYSIQKKSATDADNFLRISAEIPQLPDFMFVLFLIAPTVFQLQEHILKRVNQIKSRYALLKNQKSE